MKTTKDRNFWWEKTGRANTSDQNNLHAVRHFFDKLKKETRQDWFHALRPHVQTRCYGLMPKFKMPKDKMSKKYLKCRG
jgi:hypothetical protein